MALGQGILAGKKTYLVAISGAITAIAAYLYGGIELDLLIKSLFEAVAVFTTRAAIAKV